MVSTGDSQWVSARSGQTMTLQTHPAVHTNTFSVGTGTSFSDEGNINWTFTEENPREILMRSPLIGPDKGAKTAVIKFEPKNSHNNSILLPDLAAALGFDHFDFVQYVTYDPAPPTTASGKQLTAPYLDPPLGGYTYVDEDGPYIFPQDRLPYYWEEKERRTNTTLTSFKLTDTPWGDFDITNPLHHLEFYTYLVGVPDFGPFQTLGKPVRWTTNYNSEEGGIGRHKNLSEPVGGIGGIVDSELVAIADVPQSIIDLIHADGGFIDVPEPSSMSIFAIGVLAAMLVGKRRMRKLPWLVAKVESVGMIL